MLRRRQISSSHIGIRLKRKTKSASQAVYSYGSIDIWDAPHMRVLSSSLFHLKTLYAVNTVAGKRRKLCLNLSFLVAAFPDC